MEIIKRHHLGSKGQLLTWRDIFMYNSYQVTAAPRSLWDIKRVFREESSKL
jgi:hypothetical protein